MSSPQCPVPWRNIINEQRKREDERFEKGQLPAYAPVPGPPRTQNPRDKNRPSRGVVNIEECFIL